MPASPVPGFREEARANLALAGPLIAAQLASVGMTTIDTVMAGRLGAPALAAVAVGANLNVVCFVFFMGVFMACSPIVAQRAGAGRLDAGTGGFVRAALLLALGAGALWALLLHLLAPWLFAHMGLAPSTAAIGADFLAALSWSGIPFSLYFVLRFTAEGIGQTRPILVASVIGLAVNALLDWLLMYGEWGFPELGAPGCGWATTIAATVMVLVLALHFHTGGRLRGIALFARGAVPGSSAEVLRLGFPIGLILVAEAGLFVVAAVLMARFGETAVGAYQVAINFAALLFMIPLGIGLATTVRVGHALGAGDAALAVRRGKVGMQLALLNAASNALIMVAGASLIVRAYTDQADVRAMAAGFLWLAAAFQFFDGLQVAANGALRGIKDTRMPMLITVCAYWLAGFPVSWWLAFETSLGPAGIWWGLTAGLAVAGAGLSLRFLDKAPRARAQV